jgi:putative two-component system response regulator
MRAFRGMSTMYQESLDLSIYIFMDVPKVSTIGKVGVADSILLKPDKLNSDEFEEMKKHTLYGRYAIQRAEEKFGYGTSSSFLRLAKEIAYTHHERWDESGYPEGLKGEGIPISGRIMALADVYDGLTCRRVYKPSFTHKEAVSLVTQLKGIVFDPDVVDVFLEVHEEFGQIDLELADYEEANDVIHKDIHTSVEASSPTSLDKDQSTVTDLMQDVRQWKYDIIRPNQ